MRQFERIGRACTVLLLLTAAPLHAETSFDVARDLYAAADYQKALTLLDELAASEEEESSRDEVELYRALCLLALGRAEDADQTVEAIVRRDPLYKVPNDIAPRMRAAFEGAKKRLLPAIVQQRYQAAKAAFDDKRFDEAAQGFERIVATFDDPEFASITPDSPLSHLRTLAEGFHSLSLAAIPPTPPPPAPAAVPPPVVTSAPKIYYGTEPGIVLPSVVVQEFPKFNGRVPVGGILGALEVVIDQNGEVEWASMRTSVASGYDEKLIAAARTWRFRPARVDGIPVKFRKAIQIKIVPDSK